MVISQTPLRVSFVGGGTDIPIFYKQRDGCVLSTTINKYIYVILQKRANSSFVINHYSQEKVFSVDEIKHDLIRECIKLMNIKDGINVTVFSDVSVNGTGLGSSSALAVGLLSALCAYKGETIESERIAQMASKVEIDILSNPIGKQDQYACSYGGLNVFRFRQDEKVNVEPVNLSQDQLQLFFGNLFLINTDIGRNANLVLKKQIENIDNNFEFLNKMSLMPDQMKAYLETGQYDEIGRYLNEAWQLKKNLSNQISNPSIDAIFENGMEAGALGGKLLGAGRGGYILFYVPIGFHAEFLNRMNNKYKILPIEFEAQGTRIICDSIDTV